MAIAEYGHSGFQEGERIRIERSKQKTLSPEQKNGPILLLTNLGHDPIIANALSKGATSFLIKADLTPDQLIKNIRKFLPEDQPAAN